MWERLKWVGDRVIVRGLKAAGELLKGVTQYTTSKSLWSSSYVDVKSWWQILFCQISSPTGAKCPIIFFRSKTQTTTVVRNICRKLEAIFEMRFAITRQIQTEWFESTFAVIWHQPPQALTRVVTTQCSSTHTRRRPFIIEPTATFAFVSCVSCVQTCQRHLLTHPHLCGSFMATWGPGSSFVVYLCNNNLCPVFYLSPCRSTHKFSSQ